MGIEIVTHPASALDAEWFRLGQPTLEIGQVEGDDAYLFGGVSHGHRFADGRIVVVDRGSAELRYFDAAGVHLFTSGGRGEGPGEIAVVSGVVVVDSLVGVAEITRTSWFNRDGNLVRIDPLDVATQGRLLGTKRISSPQPLPRGGWFMIGTDEVAWPPPDRWAVRAYALRFPPDLSRIDTLAVHAGGLQIRVDERRWVFAPFWPRMSASAGGPEGTIYVSANDAFEIRQFDGQGELRRIIRFDAPLRPVRDQDIDEWKMQRRARAAGTPEAADVERVIAVLPFPDVFPPFRQFHVDRIGRLWAERWPRTGEDRRFTVIGADGESLGYVSVPERFGILEAGTDHLLGVRRDELDVEYVQLFSIRQPEGRE
ncbi:MAG: hypothetical protein ACC682_15695 [Gemmatimonadota bacterium]